MGFIDVHCHLDWKDFQGKEEGIVARAKEAGVTRIVSNGVDQASNRRVLALADRFAIVEPALGFYPPEGASEAFDQMSFEQELISIAKHKPLAIGEVGLDGKHVEDERLQERVFREMVALAKRLDVPLIVHSRKAEERVLAVLEELEAKKVLLHCFGGRKRLIGRAIEAGFSFSVPTSVVRDEHFRRLVEMAPLSRLFAETDAPFLSPFRDKQNEPAFVVESYKAIAQVKQLDLEEVKSNILLNAKRLFEP